MDFRNGRESRNVEDRRGQGGPHLGGRGKIGIGTLVLVLVAMYFGIDPSVVLDTATMVQPPAIESSQPGAPRSAAEDELARFTSMVLADTEDTWGPIFQSGGRQYQEPKLVLYTGPRVVPVASGRRRWGLSTVRPMARCISTCPSSTIFTVVSARRAISPRPM